MRKIMLVLENEVEQKFLLKFIKRVGFSVVAVSVGQKIADELKDFFPDIVFASALGKSSRTLEALAQIKLERGIPKIIFVRQARDTVPLNPQQKRLVDGVLYSPIDPFKLIDVLASTAGIPVNELRAKYKDILGHRSAPAPTAVEEQSDTILIIDPVRKKKYQDIVAVLHEKNKDHAQFDPDRFRKLQKAQAAELNEDEQHKKLKQNFLAKLFTAKPKPRTS